MARKTVFYGVGQFSG